MDQSSLTGESVPVPKELGDKRVRRARSTQQGAIVVRTTRAAGDTTLARIVALVEEAQEQKSRTEEIAEWAGRYYTIAVMVGGGVDDPDPAVPARARVQELLLSRDDAARGGLAAARS